MSPHYIVIRHEGHDIDGTWMDYEALPLAGESGGESLLYEAVTRITFMPTNERETRDDGARAVVYREMLSG